MDQIKKLLKNISIFGVSQFASKLLIFFLLPFYTRYLSISEYGNADLVFSSIGLLIPILTLEISSAVMRFTIENIENVEDYFSSGVVIIFIGFIVLLFFCPLFLMVHLFDGYLHLFYLLFFSTTIYTLLSYYARGCGKISLVGIVGVFNTIVVIFCNILFLTVLRIGLYGYLLAYIIGYTLSAIVFLGVLKQAKLLAVKKPNWKIGKEMLCYSIPLAPNNIAWWGVSSANKFVIQVFLTEEILGLYSVALKIPSLISTVQGIVSEGLVLSVLEQYKEKKFSDKNYYSFLYRVYSTLSILMTMTVIVMSKFIASILFAAEFSSAWIYVPLLCISPLWGSLSGYLGTFYAALKNNKGIFISTILGAFISVIVAIFGIRYLGVYSVIISNIISYFIIWLYRWINIKKILILQVNFFNDLFSWLFLIVLAICTVFVKEQIWLVLISLLLMILIIFCNIRTIREIENIIKAWFYNRRKV